MASQSPVSAIAAPRGNLRWHVIFWVFIIAAISYLDRINLSVAAPTITKEFGLSKSEMGLVFSAFALFYALSQPFAGRIADKVGPYKLIAFAIVWWGVFTALTPMKPPAPDDMAMWRNLGALTLTTYLRFDTPAQARAFSQKLPAFVERHGGVQRQRHRAIGDPLGVRQVAAMVAEAAAERAQVQRLV